MLTSWIENRFIPAHAGNSPRRNQRAVHPRACGEQHAIMAIGSSPRMRGTARPSETRGSFIPAHAGNSGGIMDAHGSRFIPAHAGNRSQVAAWTDHGSSPRMRGTEQPLPSLALQNGSSPRMRGTV